MDEQEEKNRSDSFFKQQAAKGKDAIKDEAKKQAKKKIVQFLVANPAVLITIVAVIAIVILLVVFFAGSLYVVDKWKESDVNDAKQGAISYNFGGGTTSSNTGTVDGSTGTEGNNGTGVTNADANRIEIGLNNNQNSTNGNTYEMSYNNDKDYLDKVKEDIEEKIDVTSSNFTDSELALIGALMDNGAKLDYYTEEQLHCLQGFIKAEACTQFLDIRPNSEKFDSLGNYQPAKLENLKENEIPGTILIQRTNTNIDDNGKKDKITVLEYINKTKFDEMVTNNSMDALKYFTLTDNGTLIVAKWDHTKVDVTGDYPEEIDEGMRVKSSEETQITTDEIPYLQYVKKYTMPFDFLVQLLVITEDVNFCNEITDLVFNSKIVINIEEEETITTTTDVEDYDIFSKQNKYIDYSILSENQSHFFLDKMEDDEKNRCTTYENKKATINIVTTETRHTYNFELLEVDTWNVHYLKKYANSELKTQGPTTEVIDTIGDGYEEKESIILTDETAILNDADVKQFKEEKEKEKKNECQNNLKTPTIDVTIIGTNANILINANGCTISSTTLQSGSRPTNSLPSTVTIVSKQNELDVTFIYQYNATLRNYLLIGKYIQDPECEITKLEINPFLKINTKSTVTKEVKKYQADQNPITETHIYSRDKNNELEKFLKAYDNNIKARGQTQSIGHWLFEMMEKNANTVELVDFIKYLLYIYDGTNYGVTELDIDDFFVTDMNNVSSGNSMQQFLQFLHSWEGGGTIYKDAQGVDCYKVQSDGGEGSAVGYGVDIGTHGNRLRLLGYDTSIDSLIPVEIVDEIEKESIQKSIDNIKMKTSELDLTEYQIYALVSRCYNYGDTGGLEQATKMYKYPSNETFVSAYKKYYANINNDDYFGDYTKTDFNNGLFTSYMTWLDYVESGTHPAGWEYRRKSEWSLFQTGYFGYDLKHGSGHGIDEYCTSAGAVTDFTNNINLYNADGSVNKDSINQLNNWLTTDLLNTKIHIKTYEMQGGPFAKWWDSSNNWFTSAGYKFQCTWYVYGRTNQYLEANGTSYKSWPGTKNNAAEWYSSSTNGGEKYFKCGSTPRQNSIAVWKNGNKAGHVAYVEAVDTINNKVYISHAGGGRSWFGITELGINEMKTYSGLQLLGYVYLDSPKK